ncbi:conserved hypothetical protein [Flavobacterium sp. 9AF]|uniref:hypothetical protein n=1 Tax=Flavobacterium sp. 9AF TaxID=2653142 RepID=UPI0012F06FBA|nr:hypothetical protein [Flavobacterium sp. 9AF]VXB67107.1 conserved hypothetical protein [Flavobacterium sp. 9AF]
MKKVIILFCLFYLFSCKEKTVDKPTLEINNSTLIEPVEEKNQVLNEMVEEGIKDTLNTSNDPIVNHYICYKDNEVPSRIIWISFTKDGKAIQIKYKGQKEAINLTFVSEDITEEGAHPTIETIYDEVYNGTKNGTYILTHSGVWDYVSYTREKDKKQFQFTIDHEANPYGKEPCF